MARNDHAQVCGWRDAAFVERNAGIFRSEFESFLPPDVLDFHAHTWRAPVLRDAGPASIAGHPTAKYDAGDLRRDYAVTLPGRRVKAVCFGLPQPCYDRKANNADVAAAATSDDLFALRLFDPREDTPETLSADLGAGRFRGLKPYPDYASPSSPSDATVRDMLPEWCMEIADALRLVIMLHLPRKARLADESNLSQLSDYARAFPRRSIVVAHIGRAYFLANVVGNLDRLAPLPNVYIDIAMLNNWEVLEYAFTRFPAERILFGSDAPIAFAPGKSVEINNGYTYVTPVPWELSIADTSGRVAFTSFLYEELRAVKKAVARDGARRLVRRRPVLLKRHAPSGQLLSGGGG